MGPSRGGCRRARTFRGHSVERLCPPHPRPPAKGGEPHVRRGMRGKIKYEAGSLLAHQTTPLLADRPDFIGILRLDLDAPARPTDPAEAYARAGIKTSLKNRPKHVPGGPADGVDHDPGLPDMRRLMGIVRRKTQRGMAL